MFGQDNWSWEGTFTGRVLAVFEGGPMVIVVRAGDGSWCCQQCSGVSFHTDSGRWQLRAWRSGTGLFEATAPTLADRLAGLICKGEFGTSIEGD